MVFLANGTRSCVDVCILWHRRCIRKDRVDMRLTDLKPILIDGGSAGKAYLVPHAETKNKSESRFICECAECGYKTLKIFVRDWCTNCGARYGE